MKSKFMNHKQILYRFLKDKNLLKNKTIYKKLKEINNCEYILSEHNLFNFINHCCSWAFSSEGRLFWETLHAELFIYASQFIKVTKNNILDYASEGFFSEIRNKNKALYEKIYNIKNNIINDKQ